MANSGSFTKYIDSVGGTGTTMQVNWAQTMTDEQRETQKSTVTATVKTLMDPTSDYRTLKIIQVTIDGTTTTLYNGSKRFYNNDTVGSASKVITHNADGTKSITLGVRCTTGKPSDVTGTSTVTLDATDPETQMHYYNGSNWVRLQV